MRWGSGYLFVDWVPLLAIAWMRIADKVNKGDKVCARRQASSDRFIQYVSSYSRLFKEQKVRAIGIGRLSFVWQIQDVLSHKGACAAVLVRHRPQ